MLRKVSDKLSPFGLAVLRVVAGVIMVAHGWDKLSGYDAWVSNVSGMGVPEPEVMAALSVTAELAGGLGLLVGLLTPLAALGVLANMIAAIVLVHWGNGLFARNNGFEYPLMIAAAALYLTVRGGGLLSFDALIFGRRRRRERREEERRERPLREAPA